MVVENCGTHFTSGRVVHYRFTFDDDAYVYSATKLAWTYLRIRTNYGPS